MKHEHKETTVANIPKLTPFPKYGAIEQSDIVTWFLHNHAALEYIITQQENPMTDPHNVAPPTDEDIASISDALTRHRHRTHNALAAIEDRLKALESASQAQPAPTPKPKCTKCGDTKIVFQHDMASYRDGPPQMHAICTCVTVGDVVSPKVANMLPVGSQLSQVDPAEGDWFWERNNLGWLQIGGTEAVTGFGVGDRTILRIGPAPEATQDDAYPVNCACPDCTPDHVADTSKKVATVEEIAEEFLWSDGWMNADGGPDETKAIAELLRKHGVGQPTPIADLLADPRLRPLVEIMQLRIKQYSTNWGDDYESLTDEISECIDNLPRELRAAVEAVK